MSCRLAERKRRIIGEPVTYRARFWSVVRCYPTAEGLAWFKESNPGHRFEAGLTAALAGLAPDDVVVPIAVDRDHGWLLTDDHGTTLDHADVADQPTRRIVVRRLARLQCSLLGHMTAAEHPGLLVLPPSAAGDQVRTIIREWAALPADHPLHAEPDLQQQAGQAAAALDRCAASISDRVPLDLEINDVYAANICVDRSRSTLRLRFFDFGNAIWGHPFVTLHDSSTPSRTGTKGRCHSQTGRRSTTTTLQSGTNTWGPTHTYSAQTSPQPESWSTCTGSSRGCA